ncbi:MAG: FTR1 family iron permease [Clostridiales Family XIII bacterium]|nr:FTR1 family iron permease [Clostridiales Family XIII bacterium]
MDKRLSCNKTVHILRLRHFAVAASLLLFFAVFTGTAHAASEYASWGEVAKAMSGVLDGAYGTYASGDAEGGKDGVDDAYFGYYEKLGFERATLSYLSGARAAQVEYEFSAAKKAMLAGKDAEAKAAVENLKTFLTEDAAELDGTEESSIGVFLASLLIITREGFEAIIIVGAIIAYLIKSGNKDKARAVYIGSVIALAASVLMAFILNSLAGANGENQEIVEGVTMLVAVAVLFYVSNWMVSKSEAEAWTKYIEGKVAGSISRGSMFSLAFAAFLAVFREGAETILFYQALSADTDTYKNMVWTGLGVGAVLLVVIYLAIRFLSIKLPLKPFFLGTSVLLFIMSIMFTGSGIKELQEGNVIGVTPIPGGLTVDILGIYPTAETLLPQLALLAVTVIAFVVQIRKGNRMKKEAS